MQVVLQAVAVDIPHAVEVAGGEPLRLKNLLGAGATYRFQEQALKLVVADAVVLARTDIVIVLPELLRHLGAAYALQESPTVFHRRPLQHAADRHMEHDGVVVVEDSGVEDTRLAEADPSADRRAGDDTLAHGFGQSVVVVCRDADRVAGASPVERLAAVAHLGNTTYIDHLRLLLLRLRQDGVAHILRRGDIGLARSARTVVGLRRHHASHMQDDVGTRYAAQHIVVARQVAPDNLHAVGVGREFLFVLCTRTC